MRIAKLLLLIIGALLLVYAALPLAYFVYAASRGKVRFEVTGYALEGDELIVKCRAVNMEPFALRNLRIEILSDARAVGEALVGDVAPMSVKEFNVTIPAALAARGEQLGIRASFNVEWFRVSVEWKG